MSETHDGGAAPEQHSTPEGSHAPESQPESSDRPTEPILRDRGHTTRKIPSVPPVPQAPSVLGASAAPKPSSDAPAPPSSGVPPAGVPTSGQSHAQPPQTPYGQTQGGQPQYGQTHYGQPQYGQTQYGQPQYGQTQDGPPGAAQSPYGPQYSHPGYTQQGYTPPGYTPPGYPQQQPYTQPGYPQQPPYVQPYTNYAPPEPKGLSIASMVCGIASVAGFAVFVLPSIAAVVLGHLGLAREPAGRGFAIAGLVMGYLSILFTILGIIFFLSILASISQYNGY